MRISDWSSDVCSSDLWCGGAALMALPFYIVQADALGLGLKDAAILLAAQTTGALMSNLPWGWWGDKWGKVSLLRAIAFGRMTPPIVILVRSEEHTSELQSLMRNSYAVFCSKKKKTQHIL